MEEDHSSICLPNCQDGIDDDAAPLLLCKGFHCFASLLTSRLDALHFLQPLATSRGQLLSSTHCQSIALRVAIKIKEERQWDPLTSWQSLLSVGGVVPVQGQKLDKDGTLTGTIQCGKHSSTASVRIIGQPSIHSNGTTAVILIEECAATCRALVLLHECLVWRLVMLKTLPGLDLGWEMATVSEMPAEELRHALVALQEAHVRAVKDSCDKAKMLRHTLDAASGDERRQLAEQLLANVQMVQDRMQVVWKDMRRHFLLM
ncbi:unnamed protein product [Ostreobium quekettii]|uniref:Uncharacterized protein n=1 Tax=Ostreobium quekettii TaxID=121088 RepID=A0A8S1ITD5_9CHLO|nr:unnamed protein product [Ostreobium quekettii]